MNLPLASIQFGWVIFWAFRREVGNIFNNLSIEWHVFRNTQMQAPFGAKS